MTVLLNFFPQVEGFSAVGTGDLKDTCSYDNIILELGKCKELTLLDPILNS